MPRRKPSAGRVKPKPKPAPDLLDSFVDGGSETTEQENKGTEEQKNTRTKTKAPKKAVRYNISTRMDQALRKLHYELDMPKSAIVERAFWNWFEREGFEL